MSRTLVARLLLACLIITLGLILSTAQDSVEFVFQSAPRPMPSAVLTKTGSRLELYFASIRQGGTGLLRLSGERIKGARLEFRARERQFFQVEDDAWYALLIVDMDASPRLHELNISVDQGADKLSYTPEVRIDSARYILQEFEIPEDRAYLVDPETEDAEFARLREITEHRGSEPLWGAAGFGLPLESETTSPYGAYRVLNDGIETRHTGWDQRAPDGTAVHAMASGTVAFAGQLEIRGNAVVIDHGLGVFTLYAHLSETNVTEGAKVDAGQIIGASGNSGRSSGPHLHWEAIVHGQWVDGLALVANWLPS